MPSSVTVWLSALLLASTSLASPLAAENNNGKRSQPVRRDLYPRASYPMPRGVNSPMQPGISTTCSQYYKAVKGDTCASIANTYHISEEQFEAWNPPAGGSSCKSLWEGYYFCVAGGGGESTATGGAVVVTSTVCVASSTASVVSAANNNNNIGGAFVSSTTAAAVPATTTAVKSTPSSTPSSAPSSAPSSGGGACEPAMPEYVDPNKGDQYPNAQLVCKATTKDYSICSESNPCVGAATVYDVSGMADMDAVSSGATACGASYANSFVGVALSSDYVMGTLSSGEPRNPYCDGKTTITVKYGNSVASNIPVIDKCAGCQSKGHIDLTYGAWDKVFSTKSTDAGHLEVSWYFDS